MYSLFLNTITVFPCIYITLHMRSDHKSDLIVSAKDTLGPSSVNVLDLVIPLYLVLFIASPQGSARFSFHEELNFFLSAGAHKHRSILTKSTARS